MFIFKAKNVARFLRKAWKEQEDLGHTYLKSQRPYSMGLCSCPIGREWVSDDDRHPGKKG